jgi:hypothetical protein
VKPAAKITYKRLRKPTSIDPTDLDMCSDTELVEICRRMGKTHVSRALHRDDILLQILDPREGPPDLLEEIRLKTHKKVRGQSLLRTVMNCDLNCPACPHDKVVQCYAINHEVVDLISLEES